MHEIINEYAKFGPLFLVDEKHYAEFCSHLKLVTYKKSDFFLKDGEKYQYLGIKPPSLSRIRRRILKR